MKAIHVAMVSILALTLSACCGGSSTSTTPATGSGAATPAATTEDKAADDGFAEVPNSDGLKVKVPSNAVPNGIGGAAGFHSEDNSFGFTVMDAAADRTIDVAKKEAEELFFKEWIASEPTADGWVLTYKAAKMDLNGDQPKEVGIMFSFEVQKKVGDKAYKCYGSVEKEAGLAPSVEACKSLKR
jgi:hypothetical protein